MDARLNDWMLGACSSSPDHLEHEEGPYRAREKSLDTDAKAQQAADMAANRRLRQIYAAKAYGMAAACIVMWTCLLLLQGSIKATLGIEMWSDQVLIAVTTGVTVSVLAAFLGVIRGLFPGREAGKDGPAPALP
ncbi:hypothetical protein [Roseateles sp.]|uniref:hypothetical protein n=1 Tax=Roseateles sp. TaxID=1971397 RepID=UPI0031DB31B4